MEVAVQDRAIKQATNFTSKKDDEHKEQRNELEQQQKEVEEKQKIVCEQAFEADKKDTKSKDLKIDKKEQQRALISKSEHN